MQKEKSPPVNLEKYLEGKKHKYMSYEEASRMYGMPYWSFVSLAKEAKATWKLRKTAMVDIVVLDKYLEEHCVITEDEDVVLMACIANECHVSIDAVVQWKKGKNSPGDLEFVKIIAKILVVDYKMLICEVSQNDIKENEIQKIAEFQDYIRENTIQENINVIEYKNKENFSLG